MVTNWISYVRSVCYASNHERNTDSETGVHDHCVVPCFVTFTCHIRDYGIIANIPCNLLPMKGRLSRNVMICDAKKKIGYFSE
jgi:peroxiredoxin